MDRFIDTIEWIAAGFVGIVAANIFIAVLLRNIFNYSIPDSFDIGRMLLGILIFWGIAATSYRGGHITVDLVWANVGPKYQRMIDVFATLVLLFVVSVQTWTLFDKVRGTYNDNVLTFDMHMPTWPFFALAWAGLADAYVRIAFEAQPEGDWYARAQSMCDRALALDPDLPEARYVRARIMWSPPGGWDHGGAMRELMAALTGRPGLDDAHIRLGVVLWHVGLIDEAQRSIDRALALSPGHLLATGHRASCLYHRGEFAAARDVVDGVARENQSYWHQYVAGHSRLRLGDLDEAAAAAERMILVGAEARSHGHGLHALVAACRGDRAAALLAVEEVVATKKSFGHYHHDQYDIACVHALLGAPGEALRELRLAVANGYACHPFFAIDPFLRSLHPEPAFAEFLDDVRREGAGYARLHAGLAPAGGV
jgi:TRAP-type C4-dicarboxylate transport system permease small subunit